MYRGLQHCQTCFRHFVMYGIVHPMAELSEFQKGIVVNRIADEVETATASPYVSEKTKLKLIRLITGEAIREVSAPLQPSVLPKPNDRTIDKMAEMQKKLREEGCEDERAEHILARYLHGLLLAQQDEESIARQN